MFKNNAYRTGSILMYFCIDALGCHGSRNDI